MRRLRIGRLRIWRFRGRDGDGRGGGGGRTINKLAQRAGCMWSRLRCRGCRLTRGGPQRQCYARRYREGLLAGFFRYLTKPIKIAEFMQTLDLALDLPPSGPNV
jgi:hypothetical protein